MYISPGQIQIQIIPNAMYFNTSAFKSISNTSTSSLALFMCVCIMYTVVYVFVY